MNVYHRPYFVGFALQIYYFALESLLSPFISIYILSHKRHTVALAHARKYRAIDFVEFNAVPTWGKFLIETYTIVIDFCATSFGYSNVLVIEFDCSRVVLRGLLHIFYSTHHFIHVSHKRRAMTTAHAPMYYTIDFCRFNAALTLDKFLLGLISLQWILTVYRSVSIGCVYRLNLEDCMFM